MNAPPFQLGILRLNPTPMVHSDDEEGSSMLTHGQPETQSWYSRWSAGDWLITGALWVVGTVADKWPPFENDIKPQLHDPAISYAHTPADSQAVPSQLLWRLGIWLPAGV